MYIYPRRFSAGDIFYEKNEFQFIAQSSKFVILSEAVQSTAKSKDLRPDLTANVIKVRRFFDFALRAPLRMTCLMVHSNSPINSHYVHRSVEKYQQKDTEKKKLRIYFCNLLCYYVFGEDWDF